MSDFENNTQNQDWNQKEDTSASLNTDYSQSQDYSQNQNYGQNYGQNQGYSQNQYDQYGQPILPNQYSQYNSQSQPFSGHPNYTYTQPKKEKKYVTLPAMIAMVLVCAILFGSIGFGVARASVRSSDSNTSSSTVQEDSKSSTASSGSSATTSGSESSSSLNLKTAKSEEGALTVPEIVEKTQNSVVEITTETVTTGTWQQYISSGAGSGVIFTEDGYIVTNYHVIDGANTITVTLHDETQYSASVVGYDEQDDIALLKIDATGLTPATIGTSSDLVVGQSVVVIGNPLGKLGGSVTSGVISALNRSITIDDQTMTLLQTDAAINPGNSGGGMFDASGNLIGIVNAKSSGSDIDGIGFAIPIDTVMGILDDLKDYGYVRGRAALGVTLLEVSSEQMAWMYRLSSTGVYIYSVNAGSAAESAGLQSGDLLIAINGTKVTSMADAKSIIQSCSVGDQITIIIERNGSQKTVTVTAEEYKPSGSEEGTQSSYNGVSLSEI